MVPEIFSKGDPWAVFEQLSYTQHSKTSPVLGHWAVALTLLHSGFSRASMLLIIFCEHEEGSQIKIPSTNDEERIDLESTT